MVNFKLAVITFLGYLAGRASHYFMGNLPGPHHWIIALLLIIYAKKIFPKNEKMKTYLTYFSIGLLVSDLNDFVHLRVLELSPADLSSNKNFWGLDAILNPWAY